MAANTLDQALESAGELFITGFQGPDLLDETASFISQAGIGGVILFQHNYETPGQVAELIKNVQDCRKQLPLWICVDHEGGRVQRFKKPFTKIPEAAAITAQNSPKLAFEIAEVAAKELKAVGVNVNFAPVLDINTNPRNPVIGPRSFGQDAETVTKMASGVLRGYLVHGIEPCVKHFPGHGDTNTDSHFALPKVNTPMDELHERELKPFVRAIKSRCQMIMTAHIINTAVDPKLPATLSSKFLRDLLRTELRYTGLIISDDMEMKAIADHFGAQDAPVMALQAGCDLLIYKTEAACRTAYEAVMSALKEGKLAPELVLEAASRSRALKEKKLLPYEPVIISELTNKIGTPEHLELVKKFEADTTT